MKKNIPQFIDQQHQQMPKQVILVMQNHYPFGECQEITTQLTKVFVRQKIPLTSQNRQSIVSRGNFLRKLNNQHMIRIESILQEEDSFHFLFQYVPIKVQTWISNINEQFIEGFRDQLIKFSNFLANNDVVTNFTLSNIGMDENYNAKYFLGLEHQIDPTINREKLKSAYIRDIYNLFKPYLSKKNNIEQQDQPFKQITSSLGSNIYSNNNQNVFSSNQIQKSMRVSGPTISNTHQSYYLNKSPSLSPPKKQLKKSIPLQPQKSPNSNISRLAHISDRLNEIKSSLSLIQANKKNEDAIQIIEAQMKKTNDPSKINNILEEIVTQNKNDMSDNILKQFMDVLDDESKNQANLKTLQQNIILSEVNHPSFQKQPQSRKKNSQLQQSIDLHKRVQDAINHSMRVIDKFKNSGK